MLPTEQQDYPGFSTIACVELGNIGRNYLLRQGQPQSQQRLRQWNQVSEEMDSGSTVLPFDVILFLAGWFFLLLCSLSYF